MLWPEGIQVVSQKGLDAGNEYDDLWSKHQMTCNYDDEQVSQWQDTWDVKEEETQGPD